MKILSFLKRHWYSIAIIFVLLIAAGLRFYNYSNRWGLAFDHAHDALVGREAIRQKKIPLLGPFASGANVVGGPQWYWAIAFFTWLYPKSILSPWIGLTSLYVVFVFLMIKIGEELGDRKLGLFAGIITAFSPAQISQGVSLTNQGPMALVAAVPIWALIKYLKTKKAIFAFLLGTGIALGYNIHLQGTSLLFLLPVAVVLGWPHSFKAIFWFFIGFGFQFIPFIIFELRKDFYNLRGLLTYFLYDQYRTGVPNRWLTYVFSFWPELWTRITGGNKWLSFFQGIGISVLVIWGLLRKKIPKRILALVLSFILIFIGLRYYRGPRFESYYVFTHPFILFFSAWFVWQLYQWKKIMAFLLLLFLLAGSMKLNLAHYRVERNRTYPLVKSWERELINKFPGKKFAVYDYHLQTRDKTACLALVLSVEGLIDDHGVKIGVTRRPEPPSEKTFYEQEYLLTDISEIKEEGDGWAFLNPSEIWRETEEWYLTK